MKSTSSVEDSKWHVVRCVRLAAGGAELYLDGVRQAKSSTVSGLIDNKIELAIGGKSRCNNTTVSCDYFHGDIDYARIDRLQSTAGTTAPTTHSADHHSADHHSADHHSADHHSADHHGAGAAAGPTAIGALRRGGGGWPLGDGPWSGE